MPDVERPEFEHRYRRFSLWGFKSSTPITNWLLGILKRAPLSQIGTSTCWIEHPYHKLGRRSKETSNQPPLTQIEHKLTAWDLKTSTPITILGSRTPFISRGLKLNTPIRFLALATLNRVPLSQIVFLRSQIEHPYHRFECRYLKLFTPITNWTLPDLLSTS